MSPPGPSFARFRPSPSSPTHRVGEAALVVDYPQQQVGFVQQPDHLACLKDRQLRHLIHPHALIGGQQRVVGADENRAALVMRPADDIGEVAGWAAWCKTLL